MAHFYPDAVEYTDYMETADNLRIVIMGNKSGPFTPANWHPKICGDDDGARVTVAYYQHDYETKADAMTIARHMLREVKERRRV